MRRLKKLKPRRWAMGNGTGQRGAPTPSLVMHSYARSPCDESPRGAGQGTLTHYPLPRESRCPATCGP
jgi:hypothetical protein